jgi:DNA-binding transcriptional MerR regulator
MTDKRYYTIGELAEAAATTPRTIRYYTAEGLLPPPDTRGRYALYSADHLLRLQLIARLKEAYLPLHEIRIRIAPLSTEQVQQLLGEVDKHNPPPSSAADYITSLLHAPLPAAPPASMPPAPGPSMQLREEPQAYNTAPLPAAPLPIGHAGLRPAPKQSILSRLVPQRAQHNAQEARGSVAGESWRRVVLAPGVELHVREPLTPEAQEHVERLIAMARTLFE